MYCERRELSSRRPAVTPNEAFLVMAVHVDLSATRERHMNVVHEFCTCPPAGSCSVLPTDAESCDAADAKKQRLSAKKLERAKGFEPSTPTLARLCSTPELRPRNRPSNRWLEGGG